MRSREKQNRLPLSRPRIARIPKSRRRNTQRPSQISIALAADPANDGWRKDLGFACLSAGLPEEAATESQEICGLHPEDFALALQLGYIFRRLNRIEGAEEYFETAAQSADRNLSGQAAQALTDLESSQLRDAKQTGYDLLNGAERGKPSKYSKESTTRIPRSPSSPCNSVICTPRRTGPPMPK